jgi:hypothetical protein
VAIGHVHRDVCPEHHSMYDVRYFVKRTSGRCRSRNGNFQSTSRRSLGGETTHRRYCGSYASARVDWTFYTTTVCTMTMLDVPVVYTVETSDSVSILTEHHRAP